MDTQKQQVIERLKQANNILVTVSRNPSVDQLSAAIGITLLLNKLGKHATAVYSGKTPSTIEFLQPEKTIEKNTDSLRDFIIALDKSKADKLRYKVEDQMVKIFITPYRTSITNKDLEFSQGDFNVEVVIALGVGRQQDLDQAITAHGRILHDATVIGIATHAEAEVLGSINWVDADASSLSEMMTELGVMLDQKVLDSQIANALLTGIVAETERFSNQKTSSATMQASARLMEAGANQQLVASELATPEALGTKLSEAGDTSITSGANEVAVAQESADGSLVIEHAADKEANQPAVMDEDMELPEPDEAPPVEQIHIDYNGQIEVKAPDEAQNTTPFEAPSAEPVQESSEGSDQGSTVSGGSRLILEPPTMGGQLTANTEPEGLDPAIDPLTQRVPAPLMHHDAVEEMPPASPEPQNTANDSLADLERFISSPHQSQTAPPAPVAPVPSAPVEVPKPVSEQPVAPAPADVNSARDAVMDAVTSSTTPRLDPLQSLNAIPADLDLGDMPAVNTSPASAFVNPSATIPPAPPTQEPITPVMPPADQVPYDSHVQSDPGLPPGLITNEPTDNTAATIANPSAPPPVPPPMMPPNIG